MRADYDSLRTIFSLGNFSYETLNLILDWRRVWIVYRAFK